MAIRILIVDRSTIVRKGLNCLLSDVNGVEIVGECSEREEMDEQVLLKNPDVVIVDTYTLKVTVTEINRVKKTNPNIKFLAITGFQSKEGFQKTLDDGVTSFLLTECDKEEIIEAIERTHNGERFLCGKIVEVLTSDKEYKSPEELRNISCAGLGITEREAEIIQLIAMGLSNKQAADKLFLSTHTVNTHRKNIMSKLGVNNTAGVVMFAVKNKLLEPNQYLFSN